MQIYFQNTPLHSCFVKYFIKCSLTNKHLEDEDPYGPPVTLSPIKPISSLGFQHLRRDVVWSPNSCITVHHAGLQHKSRNKYPSEFILLWHYSLRSSFCLILRQWLDINLNIPVYEMCQQEPKLALWPSNPPEITYVQLTAKRADLSTKTVLFLNQTRAPSLQTVTHAKI